MKVLLINGSAKEKGCTYNPPGEEEKTLKQEGIETEIVWLTAGMLRDCIGCGQCNTKHRGCIFDDDCINEIIQKAEKSDGFNRIPQEGF